MYTFREGDKWIFLIVSCAEYERYLILAALLFHEILVLWVRLEIKSYKSQSLQVLRKNRKLFCNRKRMTTSAERIFTSNYFKLYSSTMFHTLGMSHLRINEKVITMKWCIVSWEDNIKVQLHCHSTNKIWNSNACWEHVLLRGCASAFSNWVSASQHQHELTTAHV